MARIRTIKPEMATDEDLAECSVEAQLLAMRILTHADDYGYFKANAKLVKAACFPLLDYDSLKVHGVLTELSRAGYIRLFEGSNGKEFGLILGFTKHQKVNRPTASKIQPFDNEDARQIRPLKEFTESSVSPHEELPQEQGTGKGTGNREQGVCDEPSGSTPPAIKKSDESPVVITIPTNRYNTIGEEYSVTEAQAREWQATYPAVDIPQTLKRIRSWNLNNSGKRKTINGVAKHIDTWLASEQDKGGNHATHKQPNQSGLDPNDTSWINELYENGTFGQGVDSQSGEPCNPPIEGDFSRLDCSPQNP